MNISMYLQATLPFFCTFCTGKPPPENEFTDNFTTQDSDRYSPDLDDLPPLDSPPPSIGTHTTTDTSYISDSSFTVTPSSLPDTTKGSGYFSNAAVSDSLDNESVWSSVGGQPSTTADSGYYKADGGLSSVGEPQDLGEDFDLFQDTFNDSNSTMSTDFLQSKQQSRNPSSTSSYYTSQGTTPAQSSSLGTTKPVAQPSSYSSLTSSTYSTSSMGTSSFSTANYPPISTSSQVQGTTNNQDEDYDLGEPVDLLSDLADEPYGDGSNFQTSYSAAPSTSSGYYHADQTTPAMSTSTAYFSTSSSVNGNGYPPFEPTTGSNLGGDDFGDDDWLPPLPDDDDLSGVPTCTSFGGSFVTHSRKT